MDDTSLLDVVVRDGLVLQQELPLVDKPLLVRVNAQEPVDLHLQTLHAVLLLDLQPKVLSNHSLNRNLHLGFEYLRVPVVASDGMFLIDFLLRIYLYELNRNICENNLMSNFTFLSFIDFC